MHTYRKHAQGNGNYLFTVGHYLRTGDSWKWLPLRDFTHEWEAACFASFMNGGRPPLGLLETLWPEFTPGEFNHD